MTQSHCWANTAGFWSIVSNIILGQANIMLVAKLHTSSPPCNTKQYENENPSYQWSLLCMYASTDSLGINSSLFQIYNGSMCCNLSHSLSSVISGWELFDSDRVNCIILVYTKSSSAVIWRRYRCWYWSYYSLLHRHGKILSNSPCYNTTLTYSTFYILYILLSSCFFLSNMTLWKLSNCSVEVDWPDSLPPAVPVKWLGAIHCWYSTAFFSYGNI